MLRYRAALAFAAVACMGGACIFPDPSGLGGADAGGLDAFVDVVDAKADAFSDAKADAATTDADAAPPHFCAAHADAAFCADFDESSDVLAGFTTLYVTDGGIVALDDAAVSSPHASLLAGDVALASGASAHGAVVVNTGLTPSSSLVIDMDMRVDALASQGTYIEALAIVCESATQSSMQLNLKGASSEVGEEIEAPDGGKSYYGHLFTTQVAMSKWTHVTISLAFKAPRTITVTIDSAVVVDHTPMVATYVTGPVDLYVGNAYSPGPSDGARIHYDNVVLRLN